MNKLPGTIINIQQSGAILLGYGTLQEMRVKHRWDAINEETNAIDNARWEKTEYVPFRFENSDTNVSTFVSTLK